jgi:hypothetical protein
MIPQKFLAFCLGGNNTGTVNVVIQGIPSTFGNSVNAKVEYVSWTNKDTPVSGPTTVSATPYAVSDGTITVPVNVTSQLYGQTRIISISELAVTQGIYFAVIKICNSETVKKIVVY